MQRFFCTLTLALAMFGCDDDDKTTPPATEMSDLAVGCQHFEFGPHHPDFAAGAGDMLPMVMVHNHYTVAVPAGGGQAVFAAPTTGEYIVLLDAADAVVTVSDANGVVAPTTAQDPGDECTAASQAMTFNLEAGSYTLSFSGASSVRTVIHGPIGGDHHHHHGEGGHMHGEGGHMHGEGGHMHGEGGHMHGEGGHMHGEGGHMHGEGGHMHGEGGHMHGEGGHMHGEGGHMHGGEGGEGGHMHGEGGHMHGEGGHMHGEGGHMHGGEGGEGGGEHHHGEGGHMHGGEHGE